MPYNEQGVGHQGPDTSHQAAERIKPERIRDKVLACLKMHSEPMSSEAIADAMGEDYRGVQPRCAELYRDGKIQPSGRQIKSSRGRFVTMWELSE